MENCEPYRRLAEAQDVGEKQGDEESDRPTAPTAGLTSGDRAGTASHAPCRPRSGTGEQYRNGCEVGALVTFSQLTSRPCQL